MSCSNNNNNIENNGVSPISNIIREKCCIGQTGCDWDGNFDDVTLEPIYVQKVYDAALFNLQGIAYAQAQTFSPKLPVGSSIVAINYINITKYFDPTDCKNPSNFRIVPHTTLQGAQFVQCNCEDEKVIGPDGTCSEKIIYVDTSCCDSINRGTPIFGSQNIKIKGLVRIDIEVRYIDPDVGSCPITQLLTGYFNIVAPGSGGDLILTNFFELCVPSTSNSAFLPRFTELCNASLTGRLMTNNITRDLTVTCDGTVEANILISVCVTCEKKIVLPVQLCVLSTGFSQLSPDTGMICSNFPSLFPKQIDEATISNENNNGNGNNNCGCGNKRTNSTQI